MHSGNKQNTYNPGGPGKPQNSDDTNRTTSTSFTGGTGASGLGGEVGKAISSIMDMDESIEAFAKKVAYAGLHGATGEQGQIGSLDDAIKNNDSLSSLSKKFSDQIDQMKEPDAILKDFNECQTTLDFVLNKTNAVNAYFAFMQGKRLLKLQAIRSQQNSRDWIKYITGKLPNLKKRSREKYMSLASFPAVEMNFEFGVERLSEFGTLYASMDDEAKKQLGPNPFKKYMENFHVDMDSNYDELRHKIDAVLEVTKLNRIGVEFPLDVMVSFLRVQDPLTGEERKHLKKLNEQDKNKPSEVVNLLNRIIKKELKRKNLIAGTDTPPTPVTTGSSSEGTDADSTPKGPNIDRLVVTLCKSLEPVTTKGVKLDGAFDRQGMLLLKAYIDQMLAMPQESQDATA